MKIIDLLNKIANGEEDLPDIIIVGVEEDKHYYNKDLKEYINQRTGEKLFEDGYGKFLKYYLNDEVEILEEEKEIPEKLDTLTYTNRNTISIWNEHRDKINEIIDYLKSKGDSDE